MRHWVFDLDGTLVDSFSHYFDALTEVFEHNGRKFLSELRVAALTLPLPELLETHLGPDRVAESLARIQERSNADARRIWPFSGVLETVEGIRKRGHRVAVWTNRDLVSARLILEHTGLDPFVETCVSASCVSRRKPDPEGLQRIVTGFGCEMAEVAMVGDHEHDMLGAKRAGTSAVRASWHGHGAVAPCTLADAQFYRFEDFAAWALPAQLN